MSNKATRNIGKTRKKEFSLVKNKQRIIQTSTIQKISTLHSRVSERMSENVEILSDLSDDEPIVSNKEIKVYPLGEYCPIDSKWQKEKCKILNLTFLSGVHFENQSSMKNLDIRCLAPVKRKGFLLMETVCLVLCHIFSPVTIAPTKKSEYYY